MLVMGLVCHTIQETNVFYIDHILPENNKENSEKFHFEIIEHKFVNVKNKEEKLAFKGAMPKTGKLGQRKIQPTLGQ